MFARAHWTNLVCWTWETDPDSLRPLVPEGTELDLFEGRQAFVSLVAFSFDNLSVLGVPALFHRRFAEVNLRFYVRDPETQDPGITFLRELVPSRLLTWLANVLFGEAYEARPALENHVSGTGDVLSLDFLDGSRDVALNARSTGPWRTVSTDPLADFLSRRTFGAPLNPAHAGSTYAVFHPDWNFRRADDWRLDAAERLFEGVPHQDLLTRPPSSVFCFDGSPVRIHLPARRKQRSR